MEQTVPVDIERHYELLFHSLNVIGRLHGERECLAWINGLKGVTVLIEPDAREQGRVSLHGRLYGTAKPFPVKRAVQFIEIWQVVAGFAYMAGTLHVQAVLDSG